MKTLESTAAHPLVAGAPRNESRTLSRRAWKRIAIVASAAAVLMGGVTTFATQSGATEQRPVQRDRLVRFGHMGCKVVEVFPKHGWICIDR
jgi:hypothetical protein